LGQLTRWFVHTGLCRDLRQALLAGHGLGLGGPPRLQAWRRFGCWKAGPPATRSWWHGRPTRPLARVGSLVGGGGGGAERRPTLRRCRGCFGGLSGACARLRGLGAPSPGGDRAPQGGGGAGQWRGEDGVGDTGKVRAACPCHPGEGGGTGKGNTARKGGGARIRGSTDNRKAGCRWHGEGTPPGRAVPRGRGTPPGRAVARGGGAGRGNTARKGGATGVRSWVGTRGGRRLVRGCRFGRGCGGWRGGWSRRGRRG
jgi:hypothetical protein